MNPDHLTEKAEAYLHRLCEEIPNRRVGSQGNGAATDLFAASVTSFGFETECPPFECIDWIDGGVQLTAQGATFEAFAGPYSLGCHVTAPLSVVSTVEEW
jgi:aminopeptidase YwaD